MYIFGSPFHAAQAFDSMDHDEEPSSYREKRTHCSICCCSGVAWKMTKFGWRLVYSHGSLEGKIHACNPNRPRFQPVNSTNEYD
jgi:hypothetical protein